MDKISFQSPPGSHQVCPGTGCPGSASACRRAEPRTSVRRSRPFSPNSPSIPNLLSKRSTEEVLPGLRSWIGFVCAVLQRHPSSPRCLAGFPVRAGSRIHGQDQPIVHHLPQQRPKDLERPLLFWWKPASLDFTLTEVKARMFSNAVLNIDGKQLKNSGESVTFHWVSQPSSNITLRLKRTRRPAMTRNRGLSFHFGFGAPRSLPIA